MTESGNVTPLGGKLSQDLNLVAGALQDMQNRELETFNSPGIPPVAFGAGGPM